MTFLPRLGSAPWRVVALGTALILIAVGFLPLFAGPGYEAALAAGLILPGIVAVTVAAQSVDRHAPPAVAYLRGVGFGVGLALLGYLVTLGHGLRVGFCDLEGGSIWYWLGGAAGAATGGAWGAVAGTLATLRRRRARRLAILLGFLGPAASAFVSILRFYGTPMVFAYDPFVGYFAGPLYDTVVAGPERLLTYRLGTLCWVVAGGVVMTHIAWTSDGRPRWCWGPGWARRMLGIAALTTAVTLHLCGARLGHWSTAASIARALGHTTTGRRCTVVHGGDVPSREAALLAADCSVHLDELEEFFQVRGPDHVRVFLFASAEEKGRYMGASRTQIAKPWREEIYLQAATYPHPVLRHELAHVVAASFGRGPFRISGPLGGWIPDPGRIEGVADAAAPGEDADLTLQQWARAMRDLGQLPSLGSVFRLTFLLQNSSTAYTVAGAFVQWIHSTYGPRVVTRWYGGSRLVDLTGHDLAALEMDWHRSLDGVPVSESALHAARLRFDRPSIFGRRCPRQVDALYQGGTQELQAGDLAAATTSFERLLRFDPTHVGARLALGTCALRRRDIDTARESFAAVEQDPRIGALARSRGTTARADLELGLGRSQARRIYAQIASVTLDEDVKRSLELKELAARNDRARASLVELLVGRPPYPPNWAAAAAELGSWSARDPADGTADYLLGRNFYQEGRWDLARAHLDTALARHFSVRRVRDEALRMRIIVACAEGDTRSVRRVYARFVEQNRLGPARQAGVQARVRRCLAAAR